MLLLAVAALGWRADLAGLLAVGVVAHWIVRRPQSATALIAYLGRGRWLLPSSAGFNLTLSPATRVGAGWAALVFVGGRRLLVLRDQLGAGDWRRLHSAIAESLALGAAHPRGPRR